MAWNDRRFARRQFAFDDVQVRAADATIGDANEHFTIGRLRNGNIGETSGLDLDSRRRFQEACFHSFGMSAAFVWTREMLFGTRGPDRTL